VKNVLILMRKEFLQRTRGKGFWIGTLAFPVLVVGLSLLPALFMHLGAQKESRIAVIDLTGRLSQASGLGASERQDRFRLFPCDSAGLPDLKKALLQKVLENELEAVVVVPARAIADPVPIELYARNVSSFERNERVRARVSAAVTELRLLDQGFDPRTVLALTRTLPMRTFKVQKEGAEERSSGSEFLVIYLLVLSLYMTLVFYGTFVLRAVIEEKSSRAVEIVLSLVRPGQLMASKILGVGSVGLLQYLIWAVILVGFFVFGGNWLQAKLGPDFAWNTIPVGTIVAFVVFFVLGYLLYWTMWAALGAMVNNETEAQQLQYPVIMLLVVPFMAMFYVLNSPHSSLSVILSLIPFFAPILMFVRVAVDPPPFVQIAASVILLLGTLWVCIWAVGRIFRVGILMFGKRPTLPEVLRWLRYG
jgi:ABC-2 type transport system permease protein